ncbi:hypothetical protein ACOMHN_056153 [Nucella lapillus]
MGDSALKPGSLVVVDDSGLRKVTFDDAGEVQTSLTQFRNALIVERLDRIFAVVQRDSPATISLFQLRNGSMIPGNSTARFYDPIAAVLGWKKSNQGWFVLCLREMLVVLKATSLELQGEIMEKAEGSDVVALCSANGHVAFPIRSPPGTVRIVCSLSESEEGWVDCDVRGVWCLWQSEEGWVDCDSEEGWVDCDVRGVWCLWQSEEGWVDCDVRGVWCLWQSEEGWVDCDSDPLDISAHESAIAAVTFTDSGDRIATASVKGTVIRLFSASNGERLQEFRRGLKRLVRVTCLAFCQNDKYLALASDKETVHIFEMERLQEAGFISCLGSVVGATGLLGSFVESYSAQERSLATACLPTAGTHTVCTVLNVCERPCVAVCSLEGSVYVFALPHARAEERRCALLSHHRLCEPPKEREPVCEPPKECELVCEPPKELADYDTWRRGLKGTEAEPRTASSPVNSDPSSEYLTANFFLYKQKD